MNKLEQLLARLDFTITDAHTFETYNPNNIEGTINAVYGLRMRADKWADAWVVFGEKRGVDYYAIYRADGARYETTSIEDAVSHLSKISKTALKESQSLKIDVDELIAQAEKNKKEHPELRYGQSIMGVLYAMNKDLYNHVIDAGLDSFYGDLVKTDKLIQYLRDRRYLEENGAGFEGTDRLRKKYVRDTPGQETKLKEGKYTMKQTYAVIDTSIDLSQHLDQIVGTSSDEQGARRIMRDMVNRNPELSKTLKVVKVKGSKNRWGETTYQIQEAKDGGGLNDILKDNKFKPLKNSVFQPLLKGQLKPEELSGDIEVWAHSLTLPLVVHLNNKWFFAGKDDGFGRARPDKRYNSMEFFAPLHGYIDNLKYTGNLKESKETYDSWIIKPRDGDQSRSVKVKAPDQVSAIEIALGRKPSQNEIDFFNFHYICIQENVDIKTKRDKKIVQLATGNHDDALLEGFLRTRPKLGSQLSIVESFAKYVSEKYDYPQDLPLPQGRITIRHMKSRNSWQVFAGKAHLDGIAGDNASEAAQELANQYSVPQGTTAMVYGYREPEKIIIPQPNNR